MTQFMNDLLASISAVREMIQHHLPTEWTPDGALAGVILLAASICVGVFGAVWARGFLSVLVGVAGFFVGQAIAGHFAQSPVIGGVMGFGLFTAAGYLMHRLWAGLAVGAFGAVVALAVYGQTTLWPEYQVYQMSLTDTQFALPSASEQAAYLDPTLASASEHVADRLQAFYQHLRQNQPQISRYGIFVPAAGLMIGFFLGAFATRLSLILTCAVTGTAVLAASLSTFATHFAQPGWETRLAEHPYALSGFLASAVLLSMLVQFCLTRPQTVVTTQSPKPA